MIKGFFIDKDKDVLTLDTADKTFSLPTWVVHSNDSGVIPVIFGYFVYFQFGDCFR